MVVSNEDDDHERLTALESPLLREDSGDEDERCLISESNNNDGDDPHQNQAARKAMLEIYRGAWPQIVVILCRTLITVTDTAVVGHLGPNELAAAAFANMWIQLTAVMIWAGCGDGTSSLTSQSAGAGNKALAGMWLQISLVTAIVMAVPIGVSWMYLGDILNIVSLSTDSKTDRDKVIRLATRFGKLSALWLIPDAITCCFSQWINGLDMTRLMVPVNLFFVVFNLLGNIVLVHGVQIWSVDIGHLGFDGSPLATSLTTLLRLFALILYVRGKLPEGYWNGFQMETFTRERVGTFLGQCLPNSFVAVLENAQFLVLTLMIAHFGEKQLGAHALMMNMFDLLSAGMYGLVEGGAMKIGKSLGSGSHKFAKDLGKYLMACMFGMGVFVAVIFLTMGNLIGHIFSDDKKTIHYAAQLSILCGVSYLFIAITFAAFALLQGQGRPQYAVVSMFTGVWVIGVPMAYVLAYPAGIGFLGVWLGSIIGYVVMTICMCYIVYYSDWEKLSHEARIRSEVEEGESRGLERRRSSLFRMPSPRI